MKIGSENIVKDKEKTYKQYDDNARILRTIMKENNEKLGFYYPELSIIDLKLYKKVHDLNINKSFIDNQEIILEFQKELMKIIPSKILYSIFSLFNWYNWYNNISSKKMNKTIVSFNYSPWLWYNY